MAKRTDDNDERKAERHRLLTQIERNADQLNKLSGSPVRDEATVLLKTMADVLVAGAASEAVKRVHAIMLGGRSAGEDALGYRDAIRVLIYFSSVTRGALRTVRAALVVADGRLVDAGDDALLAALARVGGRQSTSGALADLYMSMEPVPKTAAEQAEWKKARTRLHQSIHSALQAPGKAKPGSRRKRSL